MSDERKGAAAISLAGLLWGFNYVNTKFTISEIDPFALTLLRVLAATPLFLLVLAASRLSPLDGLRQWRTFLPLGLIGVAASQLLWVFGLQHTTPSHSALMFTMLPIFTALLAIVLLGERLGARQWAGIGSAFVGAALLATEGGIGLDQGYLFGDLLTLAAVFTFSLYTVLSKPVVAAWGTRRALALTYLYSLPFVVPFTLAPALAQDWGPGSVTIAGWASVLYTDRLRDRRHQPPAPVLAAPPAIHQGGHLLQPAADVCGGVLGRTRFRDAQLHLPAGLGPHLPRADCVPLERKIQIAFRFSPQVHYLNIEDGVYKHSQATERAVNTGKSGKKHVKKH